MSQPKASKSSIFAIIAGVIVVLLVCMAGSLFEDADKSKNYVCQMPVTGEYVVWTDGGLKWQGGGSSSNSAMDAVGLKMLLDITKSLDKTSK